MSSGGSGPSTLPSWLIRDEPNSLAGVLIFLLFTRLRTDGVFGWLLVRLGWIGLTREKKDLT
jgi:hypothetical protein